MLPGEIFSKDQCPVTPSQHFAMRKIPYAEGIGHVLWPVMVTRPDALCAVGILAQFVQNLGMVHWNALMRVIAYLNTTKDYWLTFGKGANQPEGYSDADWASQMHRHCISGYTFCMGDGAVTWSSKKQAIVALSSTEAEYVAQTHAAKELISMSLCHIFSFSARKCHNSLLLRAPCHSAITHTEGVSRNTVPVHL